MHSTQSKFLSCIMILVFPAAMLLAETNGAMLYAKGGVTINGSKVARSSAILAGDKVQTSANSAVSIASQGSTVLLPENSSVVYQGSSIQLDYGNVRVNTQKGMTTQFQSVSIAPARGSANYAIIQDKGKVQIAALTGALTLRDGARTMIVDSGKMAVREAADPGPQGGGGAAPAATGGTPTWVIVVISAVVLGAAAGIAFGAIANNSPTPASATR